METTPGDPRGGVAPGTTPRTVPEPGLLQGQLLDLLPAAVVMADLAGLVTYWSHGAESLFGWTREEATGRSVFELIVDPSEADRARQVAELVRGGSRWEGDLLVRRKDGGSIHAYLWDAPLRNSFGEVVGAIGVWEDVTERRAMEEDLRRSRELYRVLAENSQDLITLADAEGRILYASPSWQRLLGHAPADLLGVDAFSMIHPEDVARARAVMAESLSRGGAEVAEIRLRHADGHWLEFEGRTTVVRDSGGRPVMALGAARESGPRKEAERRLAARTAVTRVLAEAPSVAEAAPRILQTVCEALQWDLGAMWEVDRAREVVRCIHAWQVPGLDAVGFLGVTRSAEFASGLGLPGRVWASARPSWIRDVVEDPDFPQAAVAAEEGFHGAFAFPIILGREVLGVMEFFSRRVREPDEGLLEVMGIIGSQIGQFMERTQAEEELRFQKAVLESQSEAAPDGILVVSTDGHMISYNRRFIEMWRIPDEVRRVGTDRAALDAVRDSVEDPAEFLDRVAYLYEHPEEVSRDEIRLKDGRVFERYSAPVVDHDGTHYGRVWYFTDVTQRKRDERTLRFMVSVSELLTWSLDSRQILTRVGRLVVRNLADWCVVYLAREDGSIERVALEHEEPSKKELAQRMQEDHRINPRAKVGVPHVLRTGSSILHPDATNELVAADVFDSEGLARAIEAIAVRSWICVPLSARGRVFGAISLITSKSGRRYNAADLAIAEDMARRVALAVDNARLYQERDHIARTLQRSFIPPEPPAIPGMELEALYLPAGEGNDVGGDFYDVFDVGEGRWAVVVGDVCGKGPEAAAVMALARYTLRATAVGEGSPSRSLAALNRSVLAQVKDGRFCTACFALVKRTRRGAEISVACGGHPLPIVVRAHGQVETVGVAGTLLGAFPDPSLQDQRVVLQPGDVMVLFTDGVIEQRREGETFGEDRLRALMASVTSAEPAEIVREIQRAVLEFGEAPPRDDIAMIALRVSADEEG